MKRHTLRSGMLALLTVLTTCIFSENRCLAQASLASCIVNGDGETYDSHPSMTIAEDGATWIVWHAYHQNSDRILARRIDAQGHTDPIETVSSEGKVHGPPVLAWMGKQSLWIVWSAKTSDRWEVLARHRSGDTWGPTVTVSANDGNAIYPSAASVGNGRLLIAWSAHTDGSFGICSRMVVDGTWQEAVTVSPADVDAYRSVFATDDSATWIFWDAYDGQKYAIHGRPIFPELGTVQHISRNKHCLMPAALATGRGTYVAWLQKTDVIGGPGAITQWHELNVAERSGDGWKLIADSQGNPSAAELTQGLVAKIASKPVATWGYLGRRTQAMLLEHNGDLWLLWERKSSHLGSTTKATGDLVGRPQRGGCWQDSVVLHQGRVDYHLAQPHPATNDQFVFVASDLPQQRRLYRRLVGRLDVGKKFEQDDWVGWQPVELPLEDELTERNEVRVGDKIYRLFWADLHCHSGLSADAEGEPDELTYYARDRAGLDVVAFTENDFLYNVPLTEYEYELGNLFARVLTKEGRFLSLAGYEWTSRVPGDPAASVSDPGNWTPPYNKGTHANHRSVLYPPSSGPVVRHPEVANDIARLNRIVAQAGGLTLTQHDRFRPSGHEVEVGMELVSGWGDYISRRPQSFYDALNGGARLACVANGDSHRRAPGLSGGLTGIYAAELTQEAILDALRQRRCYATSGSRIFLDSRANGTFMGQAVEVAEREVELTLDVIGTRPITSATLIRNGRELKTFPMPGGRKFHVRFKDSSLTPGQHWYLWQVSQERVAPALPGNLSVAHGHLAWSSPHWVVVK